MIRKTWQAASLPSHFFTGLEPQEPRVGHALTLALGSVSFALLVALLVFVRLSASNAWVPILLFGLGGGVLTWLFIWFLGGLVLVRPAGLDLRAWELSAWIWIPAGIMALSLLPVAFFFPMVSLLVGYVGTLVWHLHLLRVGLKVFAPGHVGLSLTLYAIFVLILPLGLFTWLFFIFSPTV